MIREDKLISGRIFDRLIWLLLIIGFLIAFALAYQEIHAGIPDSMEALGAPCTACHLCNKPTQEDKCLKPCPGMPMSQGAIHHNLSEAPDSMLLYELSDLYQPVHFNHKSHAAMAQMGGECATCHHYSPKNKIQPCKDCHGGETNPNNLRQPGLKGAYHRHCLSCHREWSHDTKCVLCHLPTNGKLMSDQAVDTTDIIGVSHPNITVPEKRTYHTPLESGPIVTFRHKEHIVLFGLRCVDCHQKENCSYCHDLQKPTALTKTMEQVHAVCNNCHRTENCQKCHDTRERPAFSHDNTGWALNRYHNKLDCNACHPTGKKVSKIGGDCVNCHGGWNRDNFEHAVVGLELDETHAAMDCTDCHLNRKYGDKPDCSGCHDDGRTADQMPPGKKISSRM